jgi:putative FmdB family regulatory protein
MPHYEYFCHDCKKLFSKILSLVDYEKGRVVCPKCGSKKVEQRWSDFTVITSKRARERAGHLCASTSCPSVPSGLTASPTSTTR